MKNIFRLITCSVCLIATPAFAMSITITPASQSVVAGNQAAVTLDIAGLGNHTAPSVSIFDIGVAFDPSILAFSSVSYGDPVLGETGGGHARLPPQPAPASHPRRWFAYRFLMDVATPPSITLTSTLSPAFGSPSSFVLVLMRS